MKQKVEIRQVRIDDLRKLFIMGREQCGGIDACYAPSWSEKNLADILADNLELSLVAFNKKNTIIGFIIGFLENGGTVAIKWLWTLKSGDNDITEGLLRAFQQRLEEKNINKIRVSVPVSSSELIELFRKFGFTELKQVLIMENFLPKNKKSVTDSED